MKAIEVRGAYNYDSDAVAKACGTVFDPDEDRTQQQFAEEADINTIVKRFGLTGELPSPVSVPMTGDFTGATDFHTAMNLLCKRIRSSCGCRRSCVGALSMTRAICWRSWKIRPIVRKR